MNQSFKLTTFVFKLGIFIMFSFFMMMTFSKAFASDKAQTFRSVRQALWYTGAEVETGSLSVESIISENEARTEEAEIPEELTRALVMDAKSNI